LADKKEAGLLFFEEPCPFIANFNLDLSSAPPAHHHPNNQPDYNQTARDNSNDGQRAYSSGCRNRG
jgi:hypothetical protein